MNLGKGTGGIWLGKSLCIMLYRDKNLSKANGEAGFAGTRLQSNTGEVERGAESEVSVGYPAHRLCLKNKRHKAKESPLQYLYPMSSSPTFKFCGMDIS